jgi:hypothetical protein
MQTEEFKEIFLASDTGSALLYKALKFGNLDGRPHSPVILYFVSTYKLWRLLFIARYSNFKQVTLIYSLANFIFLTKFPAKRFRSTISV